MALNWRPIVKLSIISLNQQDHAAGVREKSMPIGERNRKCRLNVDRSCVRGATTSTTTTTTTTTIPRPTNALLPHASTPFNFRSTNSFIPASSLYTHTRPYIYIFVYISLFSRTCNPLFNRIVARSKLREIMPASLDRNSVRLWSNRFWRRKIRLRSISDDHRRPGRRRI